MVEFPTIRSVTTPATKSGGLMPAGPTRRQEIAEQYARDRGLAFRGQAQLRCPPTWNLPTTPSGTLLCWHVITGPVAGKRPGMLYVYGRQLDRGFPAAQFEIAGLDDVIDGLCVRRSGRSLLTRKPLPKHFTELKPADAQFNAHFRTGVRDPDSGPAALGLLDVSFTSWLVTHAARGWSSDAGTFDVMDGVLFVMGDFNSFNSLEQLDAFADVAAELADRIASWTRAN
jgi:hypothetical protein